MRPIAVVGAGAFGTALAICWAKAGFQVTLWGRDEGALAQMAKSRENARRLPGALLPDALRLAANMREIAPEAIIVVATPAQTLGNVLLDLPDGLRSAPIVLAAKGIDRQSGSLLSTIAASHTADEKLAVLSGPGFADEIAAGLPTALTLAAANPLAGELQRNLSTETLRLYTSPDLIGVQLGGALKNVIAIACGIAIGAGLGESARAALMTRGFAEIVRLGRALGAESATFTGLSGLGDLSLTCGSAKSRNFARGLEIGRGSDNDAKGTVEGIATADAVLALSTHHGIELPVAQATAGVLAGNLSVKDAMQDLLSRPLRAEG